MSNCLLAFNNRIEASALSGGNWLAALPLANLQNPIIGVPARSNGLLVSATKFLIDVGVDKVTRAIGLIAHNMTLEAKVRIRASEADPDMLTGVLFDTGWLEAWPPVYDSEALEWEAPNYWSGQYTDEEREGLTYTYIKSADVNMLARYWLVEIDDGANPDGYIQIGRVFVGEAWQPTINMSYGAGLGLEDPSEIDESLSGAEFYDERPKYRVAQFSIENLGVDEAMSRAFDLMRRVGTTREVLFQYDPADTFHAQRRSFVGRLRQLSPLECMNVDAHGVQYEVKEKL